jgi:hypothetical protein
MKYDVFISCRHFDYGIAEEVSAFLKEKGLKVFFSNKSIDQEGRSLYEKVIANAIRDSANMIVICSNANYVKFDEDQEGADQGSRWVYYEWSTFHRMILDKEKPIGADIVTIYTPEVNKKDLPHRLRNRQCIPYSEYKDRILRYVDDNIRAQSNPNTEVEPEPMGYTQMTDDDRKPSVWKRLWLPLLTALLALLLGAGLYCLGYHHSKPSIVLAPADSTSNTKMLVLAGGGSVVSFLDQEYLPKKYQEEDTLKNFFERNKYPDAIYLHMPSRVALTLLAEEAMMPYSRANQRFYPVCLSAEKADTSMFTTNCNAEQIINTAGHIVQFYLGAEPLAVYVHQDVLKYHANISPKAKKITVSQLIGLLKVDSCYNIFGTSKGSGTYDAYEKALVEKTFSLDSIKGVLKNFTSQSDREYLQNLDGGKDSKPFVIMGGKYYRPQNNFNRWLESHEVLQFILEDDSHHTITRPLYLYFMAYRPENGIVKDQFFIPAEVCKLLEFLRFDVKNSDFIDDNNQLIIKGDINQLIIPIN